MRSATTAAKTPHSPARTRILTQPSSDATLHEPAGSKRRSVEVFVPRIWIRALFFLAITSSATAQNVPTIGLFADPSGTDCNVVTTLGIPVTAYVLLVPRNNPASLTEARISIELDPMV
jgi:hypothetical protein